MIYVHKKENYNETLEPLCEALDKVTVGEHILLKECEQDCVENEISKIEKMLNMKSSSNASNYVGSRIKQILRKNKKALMEGIRHNITHYNDQTGNNVGTMKFVFKVKDKNDEGNNLVGTSPYEENAPKFITRY